MTQSALAKRVLDEYAAARDSLPASVVDPQRRQAAIETLAARGLPTSREENWRYTNLRPLERARFAPVAAQTVSIPELPARLEGFARYTFVDGTLAAGDAQGEGVSITAARQLRALPALNALPEARLALLNEAFAIDTAAIHVRRTSEEPARIELVFVALAGADVGASYPRVEISLDPASRLILVERHLSAAGAASLVNSSVNVDVGRGARLTHYRLQQVSARATWLDTLSAVLAADAHYGLVAVNTGGLSARSTTHVRMAGAGAELSLSVAALGDRQQVQDNFSLVEHIAPRARTEQSFRGIASGRGRVAFNGKIAVHEGAAGTDSRQSLRGLLAGPEAEIDVRPQLEIYTDDVRCSHGATAGKLDESMLFYLLSRGLSPEVAQRLLKWAFLEDVVSKIEIPELRRQIEHDLAGQMADAASLKELL
ncbi:MAG: SufD family Fe-S cluster assembly protein [Steroidobacteraceae bacterium]